VGTPDYKNSPKGRGLVCKTKYTSIALHLRYSGFHIRLDIVSVNVVVRSTLTKSQDAMYSLGHG